MGDVAFPNTPAPVTQTQIGSIQGNDLGGHAPLTGAHIYLLQASVSGYGTQVTSLLNASYKTGSAYPTIANVSDPNIPTSGTGTPWYYETSDAAGEYNITGDYTVHRWSARVSLRLWR